MGIRKKLSDVSKRQSSLLTKVHYEQEREIDKSYTERKAFEFEGKRPSSIMSNLSKSSDSHFTPRRYEPRDE